ncbi:MAG: hypothetical protein ACQERI_09785 [Candidatus Krumholzibacteriota bacterium]
MVENNIYPVTKPGRAAWITGLICSWMNPADTMAFILSARAPVERKCADRGENSYRNEKQDSLSQALPAEIEDDDSENKMI